MIRRANLGIWCDYCKAKWGKNKDGSWHPKAQVQASVTCYSLLKPERHRSYCVECVAEIQQWPGGAVFTLPEQMAFAQKMKEKAEAILNV